MYTNVLKIMIRNAYQWIGSVLSRFGSTDYRKIVLICNYGRGYLCNPKYIAEAVQRLYPGQFKLILLVKDTTEKFPPYITPVKYRSIKGLYELATARFWIDNCRGPKYIPKRDDQVYIQTWHGSLGPKIIERDAEDKLPNDYIASSMSDGVMTDLMFANNDLYEHLYKESFWYHGPVIRCGAPRNRPLIKPDLVTSNKVKRLIGVNENYSICLYAPTFRADWSIEQYRLDVDGLISALNERFDKRFVFVWKLHPNMADLMRPDFLENGFDATDFEDTQELLSATDVLLSDYSSILEDYALTGRPGFVYAPDIEQYQVERGFYYSLDLRPFPVATNQDQLLLEIRNFDENLAREMHLSFINHFGINDDGNGDEVLAEYIHDLSKIGSIVVNTIEK